MRNRISMYDIVSQEQGFVFEDYMTIDGRYLILNDNVFDLKEQKELGNVFSVENLKTIFENLNVKNSPIVDRVKDILNSSKISLTEIKSNIIKQQKLLLEQESYGNEPQVTTNEPQHSVIAKGVLWIARRLKKLLWSIGGMVVDAFLFASGIGKSVQWIPWAIVLALDVYELSSGDYGTDVEFKDASPIWKGLTIGFDILGLATTEAVSKVAANSLKFLKFTKTEEQAAKLVAGSPKAKGVLQKMYTAISSVGNKLDSAGKYLEKMPTLARWFGEILLFIPKILSWLGEMLGKILSAPGKLAAKAGEAIQGSKLVGKSLGRGLQTATNTGMMLGGITAGQTGVGAIKDNRMKSAFGNYWSNINKQLDMAF